MKKTFRFRSLLLMGALSGVLAWCSSIVYPRHATAQTATALTFTAQLPHTSCLPVTSGKTQFCFATDGLWQSINGAAYVQLGASAVAGVFKFNGRAPDASGNIAPAAGDYTCGLVTSCPGNAVQTVNGKAGPAVIIGAVTTLQ